MDRKKDWSWVKTAMPGVSALIASKRKEGLGEHVNACWHRGVLQEEPGWFWAREGADSIGTPFGTTDAEDIIKMAGSIPAAKGQALLMLGPIPAAPAAATEGGDHAQA